MTQAQQKSIPDGMSGLIPHLVCNDASAAIAFYVKAFGAVEGQRLLAPDGKVMHAMITIDGAPLFLVDEMPDYGMLGATALKGSPVTIHRYFEDVDAAFDRAVAAGATVKMPLANMFWGDRYGTLVDPFGHYWSMAKHLRDMSSDEVTAAMGRM